MDVFELTEHYWDCECVVDYIHPATEDKCKVCGAVREDQPDSRVSEVKKLFLKTEN